MILKVIHILKEGETRKINKVGIYNSVYSHCAVSNGVKVTEPVGSNSIFVISCVTTLNNNIIILEMLWGFSQGLHHVLVIK